MKSILFLLLLLLLLSCGPTITTIDDNSPGGGHINEKTGIFQRVTELKEFQYKGHLYISCEVRDGVALTHAGHCKCNIIKNR